MANKRPKKLQEIDPETGYPKKSRRHSEATILKMQEKRRARTVQPRSGTSKKADNLYKQLIKDYKDDPKFDEIKKWIEENKHLLNNSAQETKNMGIHCDYHEQYHGIYEVKVGEVLFGNKVDDVIEDDYEEEYKQQEYNEEEHEINEFFL